MSFSWATVIATAAVGVRYRRITLQVDDPAALGVPPRPDAAVGVYFGAAGGLGRSYSVRQHDGDRIVLDVLRHPDGPGSAWLGATRPGDRVGLDHAKSWYRPPPGTRRQLLVCDLAGLPAVARIVEELTADTIATVVVEAPDADDLSYLPTQHGVTVVACPGSGNGCAPSRLTDSVVHLEPHNRYDYCWFGGEATQARALRKHFRRHGWALEQTDITGYWRHDAAAWEARYAGVAAEMFTVYQRARAEGRSDKAAQAEFDDALDRVGL